MYLAASLVVSKLSSYFIVILKCLPLILVHCLILLLVKDGETRAAVWRSRVVEVYGQRELRGGVRAENDELVLPLTLTRLFGSKFVCSRRVVSHPSVMLLPRNEGRVHVARREERPGTMAGAVA